MMDLATQEVAERLLAMGKSLLDTVPLDIEGDPGLEAWEAHRATWRAEFDAAFGYLGEYDLDQPGARV